MTGAVSPVELEESFAGSAEPFRRELLAHCYRMTGSLHEAEDAVQETLLRAWRSYANFDPSRASLRTWLHRIATNTCLNALEKRQRRPLPSALSAPSSTPALSAPTDIAWLEPLPDALVSAGEDPANLVVERGSVRLAFVAALQHLPPRQRAVLLLREVLAWPAAEVADALGTTVPAVNSALQRARTQLEAASPREDDLLEPGDPVLREVVERYMRAFEEADASALVELMREDIVVEMPPSPTWYAGRVAAGAFTSGVFSARGAGWRRTRLTGANGQPAVATYMLNEDGAFYGRHVQVLSITAGGLSRIVAFDWPGMLPDFGLPEVLPATEGP